LGAEDVSLGCFFRLSRMNWAAAGRLRSMKASSTSASL
jgi:hypothetical protein